MSPTRYPSPGIYVNEFDKTLPPPVVEAIGPTTLSVGVFNRGPVKELTPIKNIKEFVNIFGLPTAENKTSWYHVKTALDYGGTALVWRLGNNTQTSSYKNLNSGLEKVIVDNNSDFYKKLNNLQGWLGNANKKLGVVARTPGKWGNSIGVSININSPRGTFKFANLLLTFTTASVTGSTYLNGRTVGTTLNITAFDNNDNPIGQFISATVVLRTTVGSNTIFHLNVPGVNISDLAPNGYGAVIPGSPNTFIQQSAAAQGRANTLTIGNTLSLVGGTSGQTITITSDRIGTEDNYIFTNNDSPNTVITNNSTYSITVGPTTYRYLLTNYIAGNVDGVIPNALDTFGNPVRWNNIRAKVSTTFYGKFNNKPNDGISVAIIDVDGKINGVAGAVLEVFSNLSLATDAVNQYGININFIERINSTSKYVYLVGEPGYDFYENYIVLGEFLSGVILNYGENIDEVTLNGNYSLIANSYSELANQDTYDIDYIIPFINYRALYDEDDNLLLAAEKEKYLDLCNYILQEVCEVTKKSILVISPPPNEVVDNVDHELNSVLFRDQLFESSFGYYIHEWLYQYDRYNKQFFWHPGASEVVGVLLRNKRLSNSFLSPAGFNRGVLINGIRLSNPSSKTSRDVLYQAQINSIISSPGDGFVLYGDKTLLTYESFFNRVNVRKTIIEIHKAGRNLLKPYLFGINNSYTRSQVTNDFVSYLNRVLLDNGISAFRVVCDESNNPQEVIDNNEMVVDIEVRPTLSINFITLNITASRNLFQVNEVVE